ncbi:hypothetical protein BST13_33330 [Mycobacterium aquaticum]|uniref:Uncharacterized protein n=2 Tax=Mycobacterium aquaticum TaxID=1927124 RepID=A0A1X0A5B5_9MYCO|nr:hypothetical protein BST13_33330 [Mycobacterium aquaticum]
MDHTPPNLLADPGWRDDGSGGRVFDARDENAVALLKVDPDKFFEITKLCLPKQKRDRAIADALKSASDEREAWEANELFDRAASDEPPTNYLEPVCVTCGKPDCSGMEAYLSRAEGTQRADSSGEVGGPESPSPERPPSDLLYEAALGLEWFVGLDGTRPPLERCQQLVAELRDLAAQFEADESEPDRLVSHEDLAAHITAVRTRLEGRGMPPFVVDQGIASSLLAKLHVTK